ncbi:hypothetical protein, partial [Carnobacterium sp.]|uniref:hypothetical protein n=1 Tax=Carnobacterium sp. TaxID=48221 RepID=UPI002FC78A06
LKKRCSRKEEGFTPASFYKARFNESTSFLSRPALMSQLLEKKTKSPQSKKILCVYFPIFLSELTGSTNFL